MYLVTGAAGFIGFHVCCRLLDAEQEVVGIDNLNSYYSKDYKMERVNKLCDYETFRFKLVDISDSFSLHELYKEYIPHTTINLAAQAGVRYSLENPDEYLHTNILGFFNVLKCCAKFKSKLIYASSSSVYGDNGNVQTEESVLNNPASLYGVTKICNELLATSYYNTHDVLSIGLRFATVYGPWGRPDMAMWKWIDAMLTGKPVDLYNYGNMTRSFTYVDDIVEGIIASSEYTGITNDVFNLGGKPINIEYVVELLSRITQIEPILNKIEAPITDPFEIIVDSSKAKDYLGVSPKVPIEEGLERFVHWYKGYIGDK